MEADGFTFMIKLQEDKSERYPVYSLEYSKEDQIQGTVSGDLSRESFYASSLFHSASWVLHTYILE